ncbi:RING/U-box superfamily protein [Striga asiatica]|uniref:RING-type E3 ubiquitin transferase n=1 Tax=Striga asiatica TaxID=4170 RepID=A0A5A7R463_STRAF|nr:RING/U-box superfamily protein [Striga asiatica]
MGDSDDFRAEAGREYALSGRIMLSAIVVLFAIIVFMVALHLYARWYVVRLRRRQIQRRRLHRRLSRGQIVMYLDARIPEAAAADRGLDRAVLNSLPVSLYTPAPAPAECAVCLSEFEEREIVRLLPKCGHSFHIDCIDMWFHSHSTCPLCRSPVEPVTCRLPEPEKKADPVEPGSSSVSWTGDSDGAASSLGGRRKGLGLAGVMIEVPPRRAEFETESTRSSPAGRILSLRRILSMGRRSAPTTPSGVGPTGELDLEIGLSDSSRVRTPS